MEKGEKIEDTIIREVKEELSLDAEIEKFLFEIESENRKDYYFLIGKYFGTPKIGGPEAERMNAENQYHLEWVEIDKFEKMKDFYPNPEGAREKLLATLNI